MGTELLLGEIDTNSVYIADRLNSIGIDVFRKTIVGDNPQRIKKTLEEALSKADVLILCGGLGPTEDDVTKEAVSEFFKRKLVVDKEIFERIYKRLSHRIPYQAIVKQAKVPLSSKVIKNPVGSAPGIIIEEMGKIVILLPGVPGELEGMMPQVISYLSEKFPSQKIIKSKTLKVWGMGESEVNEKISDLMSRANPSVALLAKKEGVYVRITAKFSPLEVDRKIKEIEKILRERLGYYIFGVDDQTLEEVVGKLLMQKNLTVSLAESCSGGLISHRLTNVPGISQCYLCGVVSYSNRAKSDILRVSPNLIKEKGAVSSEVAREMAKGARTISGADVSLGVTGIAGPTGGTPQKPVGLVFIALSSKEGEFCKKCLFSGDRESIKWKTSQEALNLLRLYLLGKLKLEVK